MNILSLLNTGYECLSKFRFKNSLAFFLGEGFEFDNCTKINYREVFNITSDNNNLFFPDLYIKQYGKRDVLFINGKFNTGKIQNLYSYFLFETVKSCGINNIVIQSGCSFIESTIKMPDIFFAKDYLALNYNKKESFSNLEKVIDIPEYLSPYESLDKELVKISELAAIDCRLKYHSGNIFYKPGKIIENPFEVAFLEKSGIDAVTFSKFNYILYGTLTNLSILPIFMVLNKCSKNFYSTFKPEQILEYKNNFKPEFYKFLNKFIEIFFERNE